MIPENKKDCRVRVPLCGIYHALSEVRMKDCLGYSPKSEKDEMCAWALDLGLAHMCNAESEAFER